MKILITGSTSPQASRKTALRGPTFASLMYYSLHSQGASVDLAEPSTSITEAELASYDAVLVGIAPPTSITATRLYPAFALANRARHLGNLVLFVDAPEPHKIQASVKSCQMNVSDLQKEFYQTRKSYLEFIESYDFQTEVYEFIDYLHTETWPTTLYPAFPWSSDEAVKRALPNAGKLVAVNLDSILINSGTITPNLELKRTYWTCDSPSTRWAERTAGTLVYPVVATKRSHWDPEEATLTRMREAIGTLVSLYRSNEVWWSPALAQSLSVGTPAVTEWRHSEILGPEWALLASTVEGMSNSERFDLAIAQRDYYLGAVAGWDQGLSQVIKDNHNQLN
jgi:hypothetical protein